MAKIEYPEKKRSMEDVIKDLIEGVRKLNNPRPWKIVEGSNSNLRYCLNCRSGNIWNYKYGFKQKAKCLDCGTEHER